MACPEPPPSEAHRKGKRKRESNSVNPQEDELEEASTQKKLKPRGVWTHLDLILSLQDRQLPLLRKIELAFEFVSSDPNAGDRGLEAVKISRLVSFLSDWVQSILISSDRRNKDTGVLDPCLDFRCWFVLRFCLRKSSITVSSNLLRPIARVFRHASAVLDSSDSRDPERFFISVSECLSLPLASDARAFHNAGVELWVSCAVEIISLASKIVTNTEHVLSGNEVLLSLSSLLLDHFASFLRFHPNPKNIFRAFVERLLEALLELLVLVHLKVDAGKGELLGILLKNVEYVLSNGLFHPVHISGFLSLNSLNVKQDIRESKGINESYHRHFFKKLEKVIVEKKAMALGGFGYLLRMFVSRAMAQKGTSMSSKGDQALRKDSEALEEAQKTSKPLFEVFMQFMEPLLRECRRCAEKDFSKPAELSEVKLVEAHCMLKSVNEILASFIQERIYVRTEDTSEETHFNFLKEICETIFSISGKMYRLWLSTLHEGDGRVKYMLPLIAREFFIAMGYFLEIEYRALGDDLIRLWLLMLSYLAVYMSYMDTKPSSLLASEILKLGSQLLDVYSELRQVNNPLFALCKAVRLLVHSDEADAVCCSTFISSHFSSVSYLKSVAVLLHSHEFRLAISNAIKSVPAGQTSGCIQQLTLDITDSLRWMKSSIEMVCGKNLGKAEHSCSTMADLELQNELLGRYLSEIYTIVLDSVTVTATNSISIGSSMKNLMKTVRSNFSVVVENHSDKFEEFFFSVTGRKLSHSEMPECGSGSCTLVDNMAWVIMFFFRLYISCRSLYRQSISLMPPDLSRKAAEAMGSLLTVFCGMDWAESPDVIDEGYFSWIVAPSISLIDMIWSLTEAFFSRSSTSYAPLIYVLHTMALQRLFDLNRQIKACEFLQEKEQRLVQIQLLENGGKQESSRKWKKLIKNFRQEAVELTSFMTGHLSLLASESQCISCSSNDTAYAKATSSGCENVWDLSVCSLDQNSLPIAVWWLLCQNADSWSAHAAKKNLKKFISYLLHSLPCYSSSTLVSMQKSRHLCEQKVTTQQISLEFLSDTVFYEQSVLYKHFTSRFCSLLKKSLSPIVSHSCASNINFDSLPDWSDVLDILETRPTSVMNDQHTSHDHSSLHRSNCVITSIHFSEDSENQSLPSVSMEVKTCENLLSLLCQMPMVHVNARSFKIYATYILNLEKLLVFNLLNYQSESSIYSPYELFRLFMSCRRTLKHLVMASADKTSGVIDPSMFSLVFDNSFSVLWLFKSVFELVGLPPDFLGDINSGKARDMIFALMDHTSHIYFTISKAHLIATSSLIENHENFKGKELKHDGLVKEGTIIEADQNSSESMESWNYLEHISETLKEQTGNLLTNLKGCLRATKLKGGVSNLNWNSISSAISCFQGFLWGLSSALDNICEDYSGGKPKKSFMMCFYASKLSNCITVFEDFVNLCLNLMLIDCGQDTVIFDTHNISNLDCDDDAKNPSENDCMENSSFKKLKSSSSHVHFAVNIFCELHRIDLSKLPHLNGNLLQSLLKGGKPQLAFALRQIFIASAAILKLKCMSLYPRNEESQSDSSHSELSSLDILLATSHIILREMAVVVGKPEPFYFAWLDGVLKYLEVVGSYLNLADPESSKDVYLQLVDTHMRAIGKCISLQGKAAILSSHGTNSDSKMLGYQNRSFNSNMLFLDHGNYRIDAFKARLRASLKNFIKSPLKLHLLTAVKAIERALIGVHQSCNVVYEVNTGNLDGGKVSSLVASGIDCLDLLLDIVSGHKRVMRRHISGLIGAVFNIVLHLQNQSIFYTEKPSVSRSHVNPDPGAVIFMCVGVLTKIVGGHAYKLDAWHVGQCLHIPAALFQDFYRLRASHRACDTLVLDNQETRSLMDMHHLIIDCQFSVDLFAACCRLLYTTIRHRKREAGRCIALLEDSVSSLLRCLETMDADLLRKGYFAWEVQESVKCASFFRRIYEEIRQQKDIFGRYSSHFLSTYICTFSGYGAHRIGIKREVDEALRPGVYSLIDICMPADLQQLHTALGEGPCRSTLAGLQHDYRLNFQFEGKI